MSVVGAAVAVLADGALNSDIVRITVSPRSSPGSVASAAMDREKSSSLVAGLSLRGPLVDVRVPSTDLCERDFEPDIGLDQLRDLQQRLPGTPSAGNSAPFAGLYRDGSAVLSAYASNACVPCR